MIDNFRFARERHPAGTKNHQGWFVTSAGSCCSNMVDSVAGADDPSAYAKASGWLLPAVISLRKFPFISVPQAFEQLP
jgi:hypothetical protein